MPIQSLTNVQKSFIRLGRIKKGKKDETAPGGMVDLDYFRMIFDASVQKDLEPAFRSVYGEKPTSINIRLAFKNIVDVWDANYECYKKGGLIAKAGENENGAYWIYYRDPSTSEVLVRDGRPVGWNGEQFMQKKIDLTAPIYSYASTKKGGETVNVPVLMEPVGRLNVVIPELANVDGVARIGFFEFCPVSPRDIRTISGELLAIELMAQAVGKSITGIPMKLTRREEQVTKNIKGVLSKGPSWVVHIEVGGEWGGKALEVIELKSLPGSHYDDDVVDGDVDEIDDEPKQLPAPKPSAHQVPVNTEPAGSTGNKQGNARPYSPEVFKAAFHGMVIGIVESYAKENIPLTLVPPNIGNVLAKILNGIFADERGDNDSARHFVIEFLTGVQSTKDLTPAQVRAFFKVMGIKYDDKHTPAFDDAPSNVSMEEFRAIWSNKADIELFGADSNPDNIPF